MSAETPLRCPQCQRWLADAAGYARLVCKGCGAEVTWRSKEARTEEIRRLTAKAKDLAQRALRQ